MTVRLGRIGIWAARWFFEGFSDAEIAEIGAELEGAGYRAVWVGAIKSSLAPADQLLGATTNLAFVSGIVNVWSEPADEVIASYRRIEDRHPGRLLLGVGAGHRENDHGYQRPLDRVNEYLDTLAAAGIPADRTALAALGPKAVTLAGRRTAGAHPYLTTPEHTRRARELLGAGPLLAPDQKVILETDPATARAIGREALAFYLGLRNYVASWRRQGFTDEDFADGGSDRLVDALIAWGDEATVAKRVTEHLDAGADHVGVQILVPGGKSGDARLPLDRFRALGPALNG